MLNWRIIVCFCHTTTSNSHKCVCVCIYIYTHTHYLLFSFEKITDWDICTQLWTYWEFLKYNGFHLFSCVCSWEKYNGLYVRTWFKGNQSIPFLGIYLCNTEKHQHLITAIAPEETWRPWDSRGGTLDEVMRKLKLLVIRIHK